MCVWGGGGVTLEACFRGWVGGSSFEVRLLRGWVMAKVVYRRVFTGEGVGERMYFLQGWGVGEGGLCGRGAGSTRSFRATYLPTHPLLTPAYRIEDTKTLQRGV